jgi:hypothetical protein
MEINPVWFFVAVLAAYFGGRYEGTLSEMKDWLVLSEMKDWLVSARDKKPLIKDGMIYEVKYLGGDD